MTRKNKDSTGRRTARRRGGKRRWRKTDRPRSAASDAAQSAHLKPASFSAATPHKLKSGGLGDRRSHHSQELESAAKDAAASASAAQSAPRDIAHRRPTSVSTASPRGSEGVDKGAAASASDLVGGGLLGPRALLGDRAGTGETDAPAVAGGLAASIAYSGPPSLRNTTDQLPSDSTGQLSGGSTEQLPIGTTDQLPGTTTNLPPVDTTDQLPGDTTTQLPGTTSDLPLGDTLVQLPGGITDQPPGTTTNLPPGDTTDQLLHNTTGQLPREPTGQLSGGTTDQLPGDTSTQLPGTTTGPLPRDTTGYRDGDRAKPAQEMALQKMLYDMCCSAAFHHLAGEGVYDEANLRRLTDRQLETMRLPYGCYNMIKDWRALSCGPPLAAPAPALSPVPRRGSLGLLPLPPLSTLASSPPLSPRTFHGGYMFSVEPVATEKLAETRSWLDAGADLEAFFQGRRAQQLHIVDLGSLVADEEAAAFRYVLEEAYKRPHWTGDAADYRKMVDLCRKFGGDPVPIRHVSAERVDLAGLGLDAADVGDFQRAVDADCRSDTRRDRGPNEKRLNFVSSHGISNLSGIKGHDGEPTITGEGMGGKAVFATKAMLAAERHGNKTFASLGMVRRGGGRFADVVSGETDPATGVAWECAPIAEAKAGLLTYGTALPDETPGQEPRKVGIHIDGSNDHGPLSQQTFGLSFLGRCVSTQREYRVVGALYMRRCVGHWVERSYSETLPTPVQLEYRAALVESMIEVAKVRWPLRKVAALDSVELEHERTRSSWDHKSANYGGLCSGDYRTWPQGHDVSLVASHIIGACGLNDAAICLGRYFPKYGSAELYQVECGADATVAARLMIGALVALSAREEGGELPAWSQPRPAVRGQGKDFHRWMPTQALLQKTCEAVLRARVCDPAPEGEQWGPATKEEALNSATEILDHLRIARDLLLDFDHPRCIAARRACHQKDCFTALELVHALPCSGGDDDTASEDAVRTQLKALSPPVNYRYARLVFPEGVDQVGLRALRDEIDKRRRLVQLRAACCELGLVSGVDPTNGVVLFGIITAFVTTKSVKPSAAMLDAILRGGWVPAGTGTKKKMRRAGLRYSEALRLGRSPLEILLRAELSSAGVIMPSDGEGEFENWPCEGDRALDKAVSGSAIVHKWCSAPGFPGVHVRETEDGLLQLVRRVRYSGYHSCDNGAIYARWQEASTARSVNPWPASWVPVWTPARKKERKKKRAATQKEGPVKKRRV